MRYPILRCTPINFLLFFFSFVPLFPSIPYSIQQEKIYQITDKQEKRSYVDVILNIGKYGESTFTISLPEKIPQGGLPCIFIVGGLQTGRESLQFIPDHGEYALVAYEYSKTLKQLHKINILWHLYAVRKAALEVPPELVSIIEYLKKQPWIDSDPISIMAYSFGSTFLPATYVLADKEGIPLGPGVMAYGGAGVYCLFKGILPLPKILKKPVAAILAATFKPVDPILYAPYMKGEFLIINGIYDKQISMGCAERLQELVPEPKTIMNLETEHMHPKNTELNLRLIDISRKWLDEKRQSYKIAKSEK